MSTPGAASGLINTVQQMGNALGLGLVSVVFFGTMSDHLTPARIGAAYADGFQNALGWVAGVMGVIFLLMFALPRRPAQHVEGAPGGGAGGGEGAHVGLSPRWDGRGGSGTSVPGPPLLSRCPFMSV